MAQKPKDTILKRLSSSISKLFGTSNSAQQPIINPATQVALSSGIPSTAPISYQGDYAKTLFLYAHKKVSAIKLSSEYNRYFYYECGIQDAAAYHLSLLNQDYLRFATLEEKLQALTVSALKDISAAFDLPQAGKKADLINRIVGLDRPSDIESRFPYQVYTALTEKGADFLAEHNDYVLLHRHKDWGINWQEYDKRKNGHSFYDVVWGIFNERLSENTQDYSQNGSAQRYYCNERSICLNMFQLLQEECKTERSLAELIHVLYIDTSGVTGIDYYRTLLMNPDEREHHWRLIHETDQSSAKHSPIPVTAYADDYSIYYLPIPGLMKSLSEFQNVAKDTVLKAIDKCFEEQLPMQICSKELFTQIVLSAIDGSYDEPKVNENLTQSFLVYMRMK